MMSFATINKTKAIIIIEFVLFFFLILFGISGSSISNIRGWAPASIFMDEKILIGHPQTIRSDEWAVNSLLSIGQYQNKENKNPRINSNIGPTPRDMSIVHDTGVPTSELSTISKVNLWGFFAFDLRRALAWDWWIPVFVGLNGIWLLLNLICPRQPLFNFSLALLFTLAPESVIWSNWPVMHVGTASFAVSFAILALKNRRMLTSLALGCVTGLFVSWFVLQLYLPRLIPVALIAVATYAGYCVTNRVKFFTRTNCASILYTVLIVSLMLFDWYSKNYDGISRMLGSSYPGQRRIYGGTPLANWDWSYVSGWMFPVTAYRNIYTNVCEQQSYISLFIPVFILVLYYLVQHYRRINYIVLFNFGLLLLFMAYEFTGIPEIVGKLTLLNRTKQARAIIGVGFSTIILIAFLYRYRSMIVVRQKLLLLPVIFLPFIIFFCSSQGMIYKLGEAEGNLFKLVYSALFIVVVNVLLLYRIKYVTIALLLFVMPVTLFWNPLIVAPSKLSVGLPEQLTRSNSRDLKYDGRILVVGGDKLANLFFASGYKVMNATSHYVDPFMFSNFYSKLDNPNRYNTFNHLGVLIDNKYPDMRIFSVPGQIAMRLNARKFDFSKLPADYMAVRKMPLIHDLGSNSKVKFIDRKGDFYFYEISH